MGLSQQKIISGILLAAIAVLVAIKIPTLNLPHYWDEAFPYSYAIGYMVENGPSILPDAAPVEYTTGHPLLYYFLQSSWNLLVGPAIWLQRLFPLFISIGMLFMAFLVGKAIYNAQIGAGAAVLLLCQNAFLSNATFQLPETLLSLLLLCSIYFLVKGRLLLFSISSTLLLFTKEPAIALISVLFSWHFFVMMRGQSFLQRLKKSWVYLLPIGLNFLFYLCQYYMHGWFLFPRHTGFMTFTLEFFLNQFERYAAHLFIYSGRNGMFFLALASVAFLLVSQRKRLHFRIAGKQSLLLLAVILVFLLFSAVNFYSNRYILCLFPLFCLLVSAGVYHGFGKYRFIFPSTIGILSAVAMFFTFHSKRSSDNSMGYADEVRVQKMAIDYCLEQEWRGKGIFCWYLMSKYLRSHYPRYVNKNQVFTNLKTNKETSEILIITSNEMELHYLINAPNYNLVKRFSRGVAWCEIRRSI